MRVPRRPFTKKDQPKKNQKIKKKSKNRLVWSARASERRQNESPLFLSHALSLAVGPTLSRRGVATACVVEFWQILPLTSKERKRKNRSDNCGEEGSRREPTRTSENGSEQAALRQEDQRKRRLDGDVGWQIGRAHV